MALDRTPFGDDAMTTRFVRLVPALLLGLLLPGSLLAAEGGTSPSGQTSQNPPPDTGATTLDVDLTYDFEVWAADYETNWYLTIHYADGGTSTHVFKTYQGALDVAAYYAFHVVQAVDFDIDPVYELGDFLFVETFDLRADAEDLRDLLEGIGLVVDIRWIKESRRSTWTWTGTRNTTDGRRAAGLR